MVLLLLRVDTSRATQRRRAEALPLPVRAPCLLPRAVMPGPPKSVSLKARRGQTMPQCSFGAAW
jgi:hypothetical protein